MSRPRKGSPPQNRKSAPSADAPVRRRYDSPVRRQQSSDTREKIVTSGAQLVRSFTGWDWRGLTFRAVGERAGVSERTVHRYFANERALRDAVVQRLIAESGVPLNRLELDNFATSTAKLFAYLAQFATPPAEAAEPALVAIDVQRRSLLRDAVARAAPQWPATEREMAAAMLDMLWHVPSYERLVTAWQFDVAQATRAISWVIGLVETAIREDRRPGQRG
jgi:AcrR family transcriptional regulator